MNILRRLSGIAGRFDSPSEEISSWQLILICADGLPEVQGYDTEEEAKRMGEKQIGVGDEEFKVIEYDIKPITTSALIAGMKADCR